MKKIKNGDTLTIYAKETVVKQSILTVGDEITIEEAQQLINLMCDSEEFTDNDEGYCDLNWFIGDESSIIDTFGYHDVQYKINNIKEE
jgi:hypothetical protein